MWSKQKGPFPISAPTGIFELRTSFLPSYSVWDKYFFLYYNVINGSFGPVSPYPLYNGNLAKIYSLLNIKYLAITYDRLWPPAYEARGINNKNLMKIVQELEKAPYAELIWKGQHLAIFKLNNDPAEIYIGDISMLCSCKLNKIASVMDVSRMNTKIALIIPEKDDRIMKIFDLTDIAITDDMLVPLYIFAKDKLILMPYKFTLTAESVGEWVRGELNGFHLRKFYRQQLEWNWDTDLGCGFVYTSSKRAILDMSFDVSKSDRYKIFIRYFENQRGGAIRIYLDGELIAEVNTVSQLNRFVWRDLGVYKLEPGRHVLTLENVEGFNAVNVFVLVPVD
jgi:hypothetical protein